MSPMPEQEVLFREDSKIKMERPYDRNWCTRWQIWVNIVHTC
jgi:hypothetical protein